MAYSSSRAGAQGVDGLALGPEEPGANLARKLRRALGVSAKHRFYWAHMPMSNYKAKNGERERAQVRMPFNPSCSLATLQQWAREAQA